MFRLKPLTSCIKYCRPEVFSSKSELMMIMNHPTYYYNNQCLHRCCTSVSLITNPADKSLTTLEFNHKSSLSNNFQNELTHYELDFIFEYSNLLHNKLLYSSLESSPAIEIIKRYKFLADDIISSQPSPHLTFNEQRLLYFNDSHMQKTIIENLSQKSIIYNSNKDENLVSDDTNNNEIENIDKKDKNEKPSKEILDNVEKLLVENFTRLLSEKHDYSIYTKDIEFVNNWFPDKSYTTIGTMQYGLEIAKLKLYVHVRMANLKMTLLKVTNSVKEGAIKVRWRVVGVPHSKNLMKFFSDENNNSENNDEDSTEWLDGFSTFYVLKDGLIRKHVMDRIIPEEGHSVRSKSSMIEKLGLKMPMPIPS